MRMRILRIFMALLLLSFMAGCDDSDSDDTPVRAETLRVSLSADGALTDDSVVITAGRENILAITVTDAAGNPMPDASVIFAEDGGLLAFSGGFTNAQGELLTSVSTDEYATADRHGTIKITAANGEDVGTLSLPYRIAAWDRVLYGGELIVYASNMPNTPPRGKEFEAPKGLAFESVTPNFSEGVRMDIYEGRLRVVTSNQAVNGIRKVSVKMEGAANPVELDINIRVGNGTVTNPYPIGNTAEFLLISEHTASPTYFILDSDIDLSDVALPGMATFSGGLDGDNHSITGLKQTLFGPKGGRVYLDPPAAANFANITVKNLNITVDASGVFSSPSTSITYSAYNGIIAYIATNLTVENVHISGTFTVEGQNAVNAGFLAGQVSGILNVSDVTVDGNLIVYQSGSIGGTLSMGLLAGAATYGNIENISVNGTINASYQSTTITVIAGGVLGYLGAASTGNNNTLSRMSIKDAAVNVNINAGGTNNIFGIGGIVGNIHGAGNIIDGCYYNGDMNIGMAPDTFANNASGIGGIVGKVNTSNNQGALFPNWIKNSYSSGSVNVRGDGTPREFTYVGGVLGFELQTAANSVVNVANTYSILSVTSPGTSGGIIGGKPGTDIVSVNNVALNPSVNGDYGVTRVGAFLNASSGGNYAHEALKLFSDQGTTPVTPMEGSLEDGNSASAAFLTPEFFAGLGFSTDLWDLNFSGREYKYPLLKRLGGQEYISVPEYE